MKQTYRSQKREDGDKKPCAVHQKVADQFKLYSTRNHVVLQAVEHVCEVAEAQVEGHLVYDRMENLVHNQDYGHKVQWLGQVKAQALC